MLVSLYQISLFKVSLQQISLLKISLLNISSLKKLSHFVKRKQYFTLTIRFQIEKGIVNSIYGIY